MNKNQKYYTPEISELYVGYEIEVCTNHGYESFNNNIKIWDKHTISIKDDSGTYTNMFNDVIIGIDDGHQPVRTKYLDSNDIISLGFEEVRIKLLQSYTNSSEKELVGVFIKDNLEINYNFNTNKAYIKDDRNYGAIYFYGLCKSKNELKTLLKLIQ